MDVTKRIGETLEPLGARILIKPEAEAEKVSRGGMIIPETAQERPQVGVIAAIGAGAELAPAASLEACRDRTLTRDATGITQRGRFKLGERVVYGKFSGTEITVEQEQFIILRDDDVLAILHSASPSAPDE